MKTVELSGTILGYFEICVTLHCDAAKLIGIGISGSLDLNIGSSSFIYSIHMAGLQDKFYTLHADLILLKEHQNRLDMLFFITN